MARTAEEVGGLEPIWRQLDPSPVQSFEYFSASLTEEGVLCPYVVVAEKDGDVALVAGRLRKSSVRFRLMGLVFLKFPFKTIDIGLGGVVGLGTDSCAASVLRVLLDGLGRREADRVSFVETPTNGPLYRLAMELSGSLRRDRCPQVDRHFVMTLPPSIEDFYSMRKGSRHLKKKIRRLEKAFPGQVEIRRLSSREEIDSLCHDAAEVSASTYQAKQGEGFATDAAARLLLELASEKNCLRAYVLYLGEQPIAYWAGFVHHRAFQGLAVGGTGFKPEYGRLEVGTILLLNMIEDLCADPGVDFLDFGWQEATYKRRYCDLSWEEASFVIFRAGFKGVALSLLHCIGRAALQIRAGRRRSPTAPSTSDPN